MERMSKEDKESMMDGMIEKFFADITPEGKQKMMPKMMMGMMSGGGEDGGSPRMQGCEGQQMPEMMLGEMMPNCIEMMLPKIAPGKRGEVAATVLAALVHKGTTGMTNEQRSEFLEALADVLDRSK